MNPLTQNRMADAAADIASDFWSRQAQTRRVLTEVRRTDGGDMLRGVIYVVAMLLLSRPNSGWQDAHQVLPVLMGMVCMLYVVQRQCYAAFARSTRVFYFNLPRDARLTRNVHRVIIVSYGLLLGIVLWLGNRLGGALLHTEGGEQFFAGFALAPVVSGLIWHAAITCATANRPSWIILAMISLVVILEVLLRNLHMVFSNGIIMVFVIWLGGPAMAEYWGGRRK